MSTAPAGCLARSAQWAVWGCVPAPVRRSQRSSVLVCSHSKWPPQEHCASDSYDCNCDTPSALCLSYRSPGTHKGWVNCFLWDILNTIMHYSKCSALSPWPEPVLQQVCSCSCWSVCHGLSALPQSCKNIWAFSLPFLVLYAIALIPSETPSKMEWKFWKQRKIWPAADLFSQMLFCFLTQLCI